MLSMRAGHKREPRLVMPGFFSGRIFNWHMVEVVPKPRAGLGKILCCFRDVTSGDPAKSRRIQLFKLKVPRFLRLDHGLSAARRLAGVKGIRLAFGAVKHVQEPC